MPRIKLTKPAFATLTGTLLGVRFTNGVSGDISLRKVDAIAAAIGGDLVDGSGNVLGPAGPRYRATTVIPTPVVKHEPSVFPLNVTKRLIANMIDLAGDSRAQDAIVSVNYPENIGLSATNFLNQAIALTDQRATLGQVYGFSGRRTDEYFGDRLADMLASPAGIIVIGYPMVNNATPNADGNVSAFPYTHRKGFPVTLQNVGRVAFEDVRAAAIELVAVGKTVFVTCDPGSEGMDADRVKQLHDFNARLVVWARKTPGVFCWSANSVLWASSNSATLIRFRPDMLLAGDGTHFSIRGGYAAGKELAKALRVILPPSDTGIASISDNYGLNPRQLTRNTLFAGLSGGVRKTVAGTGNIPALWELQAAATTTCNLTSAPSANGIGNDITLQITATAADTLSFSPYAPSSDDWSLTDTFLFEAEFEIAAGSVGAHVYGNVQVNTDKGTKNWWTMHYGPDNSGKGPSEAHIRKDRSQPARVASGSTIKGYMLPQVYVKLAAGASITVTIRRVSCLKTN